MIAWKPFRYRFEYIGLLMAARIVQSLPWRWLRPLGKSIGTLFFHLDRHRRKVTLANLKAAFDGRFNDQEYWELARKSYGVFATTILELLWSPRLTHDVIDDIATIEGLDPLAKHAQPGVPAIYACLHAGNFEWVNQIHARHVSPQSVIAQKFKNPLIGHLFDSWRSTMGHRILPQERAMLKTLRHLKQGGKMGILVDLNLKPSQGPVVIKQFGRLLASVTRLPAELALRTGAILVPVECYARPEGGYHMRYYPPITITEKSSVEEITQACWDTLEQGIQEHPDSWLWSYKHWRYRPSKGETSHYPFYANKLESFDTLLEKESKNNKLH